MHINQLIPCINEAQTHSPTSAACAELAGEVKDVLAYYKFVQGVFGKAAAASGASEVMVAFHNLVTMSIKPEWFPRGKRLYCYSEVSSRLSERAGAGDAEPEDDASVQASAKDLNLVGFSDRAEQHC